MASISGAVQRRAFELACSEWAMSHGLEPDDGACMGELRIAALTVGELGEVLALRGQSHEMVTQTVGRLLLQGFLEQVETDQSQHAGPLLEQVRRELVLAEAELDLIGRELEVNPIVHRRMIGASLRQAVSRVVVARRFLESLSEPS